MSRGSLEDRPRGAMEGWRAATSMTRLVVMLAAASVAALVTGLLGAWPYAPLVAWDTAALIFTVWGWVTMASMDAPVTAAHATREDPGRAETDLIVLCACVANLASVGFLLVQAGRAQGGLQDVLAAVGVVSVVLSWFTVHCLFSLRYARLYYTGVPGGIDFHQGSSPPRYLDFAYVGFTIGMTFQVSDTDLETSEIRATALRHALLSYLFGAVTLAATINLVSGLATLNGLS